MEKPGKKKEKGKNETGFRWTYSPTGRINWTGRASIIRCTNPGPGICFEIHKSRLVLSCMHPFPVVVRPMSTNVLVFSVFTHQYPGHCNLSPPSCYALHPSPICILPHPVSIVTCILSLSVTDFFFYPHCSWSRLDTDNWTPPFSRHLWGDFVGRIGGFFVSLEERGENFSTIFLLGGFLGSFMGI